MNRIKRSWGLVKSSWSVLMDDKELMIYPVLSALVTIVGILVLAGLYLGVTGESLDDIANKVDESSDGSWSVSDIVVIYLMYFVTALITTFFNAALIGGALIRLRGGNPSFSTGLRQATGQLPAILGYSAIAATVGILIAFLRSRNNTAGNVGAGILGIAWGVMTFLVVPVLVAEKVGPADALKRSSSLLKKTWGEQIVGNAAIGLIGFLVGIPVAIIGGLLIAGASGTDSDIALAGAVVLLAILLALIGVVFSALNSIYKAALYEFAAEDIVAPQFGAPSLETAFRVK